MVRVRRGKRESRLAAWMVADNLNKDIGGAQEAGIRGIWVNRKGREPGDIQPFAEIENLFELRDFL